MLKVSFSKELHAVDDLSLKLLLRDVFLGGLKNNRIKQVRTNNALQSLIDKGLIKIYRDALCGYIEFRSDVENLVELSRNERRKTMPPLFTAIGALLTLIASLLALFV